MSKYRKSDSYTCDKLCEDYFKWKHSQRHSIAITNPSESSKTHTSLMMQKLFIVKMTVVCGGSGGWW